MVWTSHLCRICAQNGSTCYPIFEKNDRNIELKMNKCFTFKVFKDDFKPKEICNCCYVKLNELYDFVALSEASDSKFESAIYSSNRDIWLDKGSNDFADCKLNGVIVNTRNAIETHVDASNVIMVMNYEAMSTQHCLNVSESFKNELQIDYGEGDLNKQAFKNLNYNNNPTVLRHSSDFYKSIENENVYVDKNFSDEMLINKSNCDNVDKTPGGLKLNQRCLNDATVKPFSCQQCTKSFMRNVTLKAHLATHTKIKPYVCQLCPKSFAIQRDLTRHKRLHSGLYQCKYCLKNFSVPSKLERHMRTHTNVRPYMCPVENCRKSFSDKCNLEGHKVTHSANRDFVCNICNKAYKTSSRLKDHKKVHSNDMPYSCHICPKSYKWKTNLIIHMKKHDGYTCIHCQKDCGKLSALVKHRKACNGGKTS